jgi:hypothetical protein
MDERPDQIGGASGGCVDVIIDAPSATLSYAGGAGGGAAWARATGGARAAGQIIVIEHYSY